MKNAIVSFLLTAAFSLTTSAKAVTVATTRDAGSGSLRQAISNAAPGETILLSVNGTLTLTNGELFINKNLTIVGPGAGKLTIQRSTTPGTRAFRVFHIRAGMVTISGLTVQNGRESVGGGIQNETTFTLLDSIITGNVATESGGGINNLSTLTMSNCLIRANAVSGGTGNLLGGGINNQGTVTAINCTIAGNSVAGGVGGGINNDGTLSLTNSVIRSNVATGRGGGGIFNNGTVTLDTSTVASNSSTNSTGAGQGGGIDNDLGTATLNRSTVSGNLSTGAGGRPGIGGGIANLVGTVVLENSTVSGNRAANGGTGGGIVNDSGSLMITHSTVAANSVLGSSSSPGAGSGLFNSVGVIIIKNTILAANTASPPATTDLLNGTSGSIESGGFNLIGSITGPVPTGPHDQFNLTASMLKLGPLQNNGGPTFTHALLCGSPAINAGDNSGAPPTDQRGFPRILGGIIDIGAYESAAVEFSCPAPSTLECAPPSGRPATLSINVTNAGGERLVIGWTVNGRLAQTNIVPAGTVADLTFTALFPLGTNQVTISVFDSGGCMTSCSTTVIVPSRGDLYPIALNYRTLVGVPVGGILQNVYNGAQPGNFGWLTWAGSPSEPTLMASLRPPGNSSTYMNPNDRSDHLVSVGDWVQGKPGISNSDHVRRALNTLERIDITLPVWDQATGRGNTSLYHVVGFARVRLLNYLLPNQNRISARFLGLVDCD